MMKLTNKVGIVTGGAQGIGGGVAARLAEEGAMETQLRSLGVDTKIDPDLVERLP